jgi:hypothetical protein
MAAIGGFKARSTREGACRAIVINKAPTAAARDRSAAGKFLNLERKAKVMSKSKLHTVGADGNGAAAPIIPDAGDIEALWLDQKLGDGITDSSYHTVPVGKPKDFFRTVKDPAYRRRTEIYTHKPEGVIDEVHYIIAPAMRGQITEAQPCTLVTVVHRDGSVRLWPIKFPRDGERDNEAWITARAAARAGMDQWVKLVWVKRAYMTRDAQPGYAPDPDISKLPPFNELVRLALGDHGIIRDKTHAIYRELYGIKPEAAKDDAGDIGDI